MRKLRTTIDGKKFADFSYLSYPHLKLLGSHRDLETVRLEAVNSVDAYFTWVLRQI